MPQRIQRKRTKDPRPGSERPCYRCQVARAVRGQNGYCGAPCRFLARVQAGEGCWTWTGAAHNAKGYGRVDAGGVRWLAHRLSYTLFVGPIPDGFEVDHRCRNTRCVRSDHLEAITAEEHRRRTDQGAYLRARTHCPSGHEYSAANTRVSGGSRRHCRQCGRDRYASANSAA